jgi:hypothetical protein
MIRQPSLAKGLSLPEGCPDRGVVSLHRACTTVMIRPCLRGSPRLLVCGDFPPRQGVHAKDSSFGDPRSGKKPRPRETLLDGDFRFAVCAVRLVRLAGLIVAPRTFPQA